MKLNEIRSKLDPFWLFRTIFDSLLLEEYFSEALGILEFGKVFGTLQVEPKNLVYSKMYMFIVTGHIRNLIPGCLVSETVEEVSSEVSAFSTDE